MPRSHNKLTYVKLHRMAPATHDHNIIVKVIQKTTIVDKTNAQGLRIREQNVLVADETGSMFLHARNEQCDKLVEGSTVALVNAKVTLVQNRMRLGFDKWGSIKSTTMAIPGDPQLDPNFSDHVYNRIADV